MAENLLLQRGYRHALKESSVDTFHSNPDSISRSNRPARFH